MFSLLVAFLCLYQLQTQTISAAVLVGLVSEKRFLNSITLFTYRNKEYNKIISLGKILIPFSLGHYYVWIIASFSACIFFSCITLLGTWMVMILLSDIFQSFLLIISCSHCKILQPFWSQYASCLVAAAPKPGDLISTVFGCHIGAVHF